MNSKAAAAQLALCAFVLIGMLLVMEIFARRAPVFSNNGFGRVGVPRKIATVKISACLYCPLLCAYLYRFWIAGCYLAELCSGWRRRTEYR